MLVGALSGHCCCSVKRLSVEQLVAEDVALDKSCTDALSYVRTYEQLRGYHKQVQPNMVSWTNALKPSGVSAQQLYWCVSLSAVQEIARNWSCFVADWAGRHG